MTDENNQVLHELFGRCWHEEADPDGFCTCGDYHKPREWDTINPDYADDPRLVLEGMREKLGLPKLNDFLIFVAAKTQGMHAYGKIDIDLVLDKTGWLEGLAIEFLKQEK